MSRNATDIRVSKRFTRLYILALSGIAFFSILGQVLVQYFIQQQQNDSHVINLAGRQRYQSQQIVKTVLILTGRKDPPNAYRNELKNVLSTWRAYHRQLESGNLPELTTRMENSWLVKDMYQQLDAPFSRIAFHAERILQLLEHPTADAPGLIEESVQTILAHEMPFLKGMDAIVFQYEKEAQQKLQTLQRTERGLLGITLCVLLLEGLFVFRPAVRRLKTTLLQLIDSEANAKKMNEELVQVNHSLQKAEADVLAITREKHQREINEQKIRAAYVIEGQEEERKRLAREIHDGLGQMLTAMKLNIERISGLEPFPEKTRQSFSHLQGLVSQTIGEVRTISYNLMPAVLSDFGIASALKLLAEQNNRNSSTVISFFSDWDEDRLEQNLEIGIYRIAQEAINNAIKYAEAQEITLELSSDNGYLHLRIFDNGRGFEQSQLRKASFSNGINHMKMRTHLLNGQVRIATRPGKGTRIYVKVPLKYR